MVGVWQKSSQLVPHPPTDTTTLVIQRTPIQPAARANLVSARAPTPCPLDQSKSISTRYISYFVEVPPGMNNSTSNLRLILANKVPRCFVASNTPEVDISTIKLIAKTNIQSNLLEKFSSCNTTYFVSSKKELRRETIIYGEAAICWFCIPICTYFCIIGVRD